MHNISRDCSASFSNAHSNSNAFSQTTDQSSLHSRHPIIPITTTTMSSPSVQPDPVHGAVCFILLVTFALILFIGTMCLLVALVYLLQLAVTAPEDDEAQADLEIGKSCSVLFPCRLLTSSRQTRIFGHGRRNHWQGLPGTGPVQSTPRELASSADRTCRAEHQERHVQSIMRHKLQPGENRSVSANAPS